MEFSKMRMEHFLGQTIRRMKRFFFISHTNLILLHKFLNKKRNKKNLKNVEFDLSSRDTYKKISINYLFMIINENCKIARIRSIKENINSYIMNI